MLLPLEAAIDPIWIAAIALGILLLGLFAVVIGIGSGRPHS